MFNEMFFYKTMGSVLEYFGDSKKVHNFLGYILIYGLIILSATFSLSGSLQLGIATLAFGYFMYIMLFVYAPKAAILALIVMMLFFIAYMIFLYLLYLYFISMLTGNAMFSSAPSKKEKYKKRENKN